MNCTVGRIGGGFCGLRSFGTRRIPVWPHVCVKTKSAADQSHVLLHAVGPRNLEELDAAFADLEAANRSTSLAGRSETTSMERMRASPLVRVPVFRSRASAPALDSRMPNDRKSTSQNLCAEVQSG